MKEEAAWTPDGAPTEHEYDYELIVIGGGSGGIAMAKESGLLLGEGKVALLDWVEPTPIGTKWGVGGTCVNVGCIPKKLMHHAGLVGDTLAYAGKYGWQLGADKPTHDWTTLVEGVTAHIRSINFGYRKKNLPDHNVKYINAKGRFADPHTVIATDRRGKETTMTANRIVVAVGGRPTYPDTPGARELAITSDDVFQLSEAPGKTLVIGASYVALECAGFLAGLGYDVTVMVRSILLRGFDQQIADKIGAYMESHGVKFIRPATADSIELAEDGKKRKVTWTRRDNSEQSSDEFDTVLLAIGRRAETHKLNLEAAGLTVERNGKFKAVNERTNVPHIYAVGDVLDGKMELTPAAIKAGRLLAHRLYGGKTRLMNYVDIPTTVFTPLEYGSIGLSEEDAIEKLGADNVEVYHTYYTPLEWTVAERPINTCYAKLICNLADNERVIGFHVLGEHAGEITQGFGAAVKAGATKEHFDETVGIHPTSAEEFTTLDTTKRSGKTAEKSACCG